MTSANLKQGIHRMAFADNGLPEGWKNVLLADVGTITTGNTPPRKDISNFGDVFPWVKPSDLDQFDPVTITQEYLSEKGAKKARLLPAGTTMVSCIGNLGKVGLAGTALATNQQINSITFNNDLVDAKYGFFYFKTLKSWLEDHASATTLPIINKQRFSHAPFLLPPLAEQKRIVAKVEQLLARVNAARERLAKVPEILKRFRQSILAAACSGRLTADWREKQTNVRPVKEVLGRIQRSRLEQATSPKEETRGYLFIPGKRRFKTTPRDLGIYCVRQTL
jgi:type I restriction enzyme S subunit